jgi:hypothetical protein
MGSALSLRSDFDGARLRRLARQTRDADQARRLLSLASIDDGGRGGAQSFGHRDAALPCEAFNPVFFGLRNSDPNRRILHSSSFWGSTGDWSPWSAARVHTAMADNGSHSKICAYKKRIELMGWMPPPAAIGLTPRTESTLRFPRNILRTGLGLSGFQQAMYPRRVAPLPSWIGR